MEDVTFAGIWRLSFQFAFRDFLAHLAPLPDFFGSLHFSFLPTPAFFPLHFSSLGNTLALSDFLLHSGDTPSVYFSQRVRIQSHQHILGVLRENPGSSDMSAHRYAEARMEESLGGGGALWYCSHLTSGSQTVR